MLSIYPDPPSLRWVFYDFSFVHNDGQLMFGSIHYICIFNIRLDIILPTTSIYTAPLIHGNRQFVFSRLIIDVAISIYKCTRKALERNVSPAKNSENKITGAKFIAQYARLHVFGITYSARASSRSLVNFSWKIVATFQRKTRRI